MEGDAKMSVMPKVALVMDALPGLGGAEKVLIAAMELFPESPIYTLIYNRAAFAQTPIAQRQVITSYLDRLPLAYTQYRKFLPLMPHAIAQFDLSKFDKVVSFSYAVAHGITTRPRQTHLSYTFTPMRYAWRHIGLDGLQKPSNLMLSIFFSSFRRWDLKAVAQVDGFASVSNWIGDWVRSIYQRESVVIYPPVEVERFTAQVKRENYYITVSRLVAHKRIDLIVAAFNRLKLPLLVVGNGPECARLEQQAGENIHFLGFQPDEQVNKLLGRARGYICAGEEDFGIAMVEAQAAGCPVIAYSSGGARETVLNGKTGLLFEDQSVESLADAVNRSERCSFDLLDLHLNAERFNRLHFQEKFKKYIDGF